MPVGAEADIIKGMYLFKQGGESAGPRVQLLGSGTIFREVIAAADLLKQDWGVEADLWGCPSFNELARNGQDVRAGTCCTRWKRRSCRTSSRSWRAPRVRSSLRPTTSSCSPSRSVPFVKAPYVTLGTDGFGRSDTREKLRHHFEVDRHWVTLPAKALADKAKSARDGCRCPGQVQP
jgi:pyruvate dehydrogenase E1 component